MNSEEKQKISITLNPESINAEKMNSFLIETKKFTSETNTKVNSLVEENLKLNNYMIQINNQNRTFQALISQNETSMAEKDREISFLNNKIKFMEDEKFFKIDNSNQSTNHSSSNNELILKEYNSKIFALSKENQNSYHTIMQQNEENSNLHEAISQLKIKTQDQEETIVELNTLLQEANVKLFYNVTNISKLQKDLEVSEQVKANYIKNIEQLLLENTKLQNSFIGFTKKTEVTLNQISQEIEAKDLMIINYEKILKLTNEKLDSLEAEKGNLTVGFAIENLKNDEKVFFEKEKIQDLVSTTDVIDNLNRLLSEKIDENDFLIEEIEKLKAEIIKKDKEKSSRYETIEKQQRNLEKLLSHITSLNQIITNQKKQLNSFTETSTIAFSLIEELKLFGKYLYKESKINKDFKFDQDFFREIFNEFRIIFKNLRESNQDFKDKLFSMVMINENLIKIIENQSFPVEEEPKVMPSDERIQYQTTIDNLKNKIYLILEENRKLNFAFEKNDSTKIFKSWSESREKIESTNLQNELTNAKKNILLLLKNNKDLLENFKNKNEKKSIFPKRKGNEEDQDEKISHLLNENKEKYVVQINSFKKQIMILKEMNKNRGLVIENLLKKLKNQKI